MIVSTILNMVDVPAMYIVIDSTGTALRRIGRPRV
jgi:hypothetical protein